MKKLLLAFVCLFALATLVACGNESNTENGGTNNETPATEATYTLGMGVVAGIGHANSAADVQVDSTVAAVVLDKDGKIVSCRIDALQNIATVADGVITTKNTTSKAELKENYNMSAALGYGMDPNNDGKVLEWYLQAQAFEAYVTGKTVAEVEAITTEENSIGYFWSTDKALLDAGCTIQIGEFREAVIAACKDEQGVTFTTSKTFTLGVAVKGELYAKDTKNATADAQGLAALYSEYAASVVIDGKIAACLNDAIQPKLAFGMAGEEGDLTYTATKRVLKEGYGMTPALGYGMDPNNDGKVLEWYLQSLAFSKHVVGMTGDQVAGMETAPNSIGYQMSTDKALLDAGCTIQITSIKVVVAASVANAR